MSVEGAVVGGEISSYWYDGVKYYDEIAGEDWKGSLQAMTYPDEFEQYQGSVQLSPGFYATLQPREGLFGLCYRTLLGDDLVSTDKGYILHLLYNVTAVTPTSSSSTLSDIPELTPFVWELHATPYPSTTHRPTAHYKLNSTEVDPYYLKLIEDVLYGTDTTPARLLTPDEIAGYLDDVITEPLPATFPGDHP